MKSFFEMTKNSRLPLYANLQLTYKCNFHCQHCYQTPLKSIQFAELDTEQWKRVIKILKEKGVLILHFTGGEVFCRRDLRELYEYAYNLNLKVAISTNASLIDDEMICFFSRSKPYKVAITMYGFSDDTYRLFTGKNNFFEVYNNILKLNKNEINLFLKAIANKINEKELMDIYNFSKKYSIDFFTFFKINNFIDGSRKPIALELDEDRVAFYQKQFGQIDKYVKYKSNNRIYEECTVGLNIVNIDPEGNMYLCECSQEKKISLLKYSFDFCWSEIGKEREKEFQVDIECNKCNQRVFCNMCPPLIKYRYGKLCKPKAECRYAENIKRMVELNYDKNA